jgi:hypothetical protein
MRPMPHDTRFRNGHRSVSGRYALTWESVVSAGPVRRLSGTDRAQGLPREDEDGTTPSAQADSSGSTLF